MTNEENKEQEGVVENVTATAEAAAEQVSEAVEAALETVTEAAAAAVNYFATEEEAEDTGRNERKTRVGLVASNKMDKTISVVIERRLQHPIYGKYVKKSKKLIAHDENNECQIGDLVRIMETRPMSRRKRWRLVSVLEKAK
ncbi:MAG: 30S ribosomal protein S17 [Bacteroidota bacterium]